MHKLGMFLTQIVAGHASPIKMSEHLPNVKESKCNKYSHTICQLTVLFSELSQSNAVVFQSGLDVINSRYCQQYT